MSDELTVYVETSVIGYLTARPGRDLVSAARQQITREWWAERSDRYRLYISQFVLDEVAAGDTDAARQRLEVVAKMPRLESTSESIELAVRLRDGLPLPPKASVDAEHMAVATVHGIHFLATWNHRHIANASLKDQFEKICRSMGFHPPVITTPDGLP